MKTLTALLTLAGVAGVGYYVYKKMNEKNDEKKDEKKDGTSAYTEYKEKRTAGDRVRRASMYAVGTIKTTADKISEGIKMVRSGDMVKKGEETVEQIRNTTDGIKEHVIETTNDLKDDIKEIKNLVTSINVSPADNTFESEDEEEAVGASGEVSEGAVPSAEDDDMQLFDSTEPAEQL